MKFAFALSVAILLLCNSYAQKTDAIPLPTKQQLAWHDMEFYLFTHFGPNTFTDKEWGLGNEPEDVFNPTNLDCDQWCRVAKAAGAKGIIITAKHHDGFCLWPSKYSTHTVRESKWKNGKGDVLKELSTACKRYGLKFGVYISPWDRNHPKYGTPEYNDVFVNMMKEIFQNYGPIWELWWDGANGEGPNGKKQVYDWHRFEQTVRKLSPTTIIFSDIGPDIRWVGNERGIAGETNWNYLDTSGFKRGAGGPPTDTLNQGNVHGKNWIPSECDVSIRPGWFYHPEEDDKVKTPEQLFDLYLKSVGRGANLLLNVPPDRTGRINEHDSSALIGFKNLRKENFRTNLVLLSTARMSSTGNVPMPQAKIADGKNATLEYFSAKQLLFATINFNKETPINCIVLYEAIQKGQKISKYNIQLFDQNGKVMREIKGTTIGRKRIVTLTTTNTTALTVVADNGYLSEIEAYHIDENLIEKKQ